MTKEDYLEKFRELAEQEKKDHDQKHAAGTCPNCGYCPHCGRGRQMMPVYPTYPTGPMWPRDYYYDPYRWTVTCGTSQTIGNLSGLQTWQNT